MVKSNANPNNPPHIYANDTLYFVTATTLHHAHLLVSPDYKDFFKNQLFSLATDYGIDLKAWVILNNHYHILFHLPNSDNLSRFFRRLHAKTATTFNQWDNQPGRQVWWNYWDWCIRNQRDYWQHFNYIHYNPIKHGYVQHLREWPYSSLFTYLETESREWLDDCRRSYPIREFWVENDDS